MGDSILYSRDRKAQRETKRKKRLKILCFFIIRFTAYTYAQAVLATRVYHNIHFTDIVYVSYRYCLYGLRGIIVGVTTRTQTHEHAMSIDINNSSCISNE